MSSKSSKKTTNPNPRIRPLEPIITRTKSAQQRRQLRNKTDKKTEKPKLTKPETKSPKTIKPVIRSKEALLKEPVKSSVEEIEQVEYYPNKLKRKLCTKKIMLKPKHNFKVVAATNKRKLATPKRGLKSPASKQGSPCNLLSPKRPKQVCNSPELTMQDMVRLVEETRSLSDEDFMEILTCPSPVWWEDPPDGGYDEDSICTRSPERLPEKSTQETKKRKITKTKPFNKTNNNSINIEQKPEQITIKPIKKDERFVQKKLKLENILGNIKNKTIKPITKVKNSINENRNRKVSDSEGDISDLSFNEEEILKNLENMDIPIEPKIPVNIKKEIDVKDIKNEIMDAYDTTSKNEKVVSENLSNVDIKSEIKEEFHCKVVHKNDDLTKSSKCDDSFNVKSVNIDNQSTNISNVDTSSCRLSSNKDSTVKKDPSCSKNLEIIKNHEQNTLDTDNSNDDNSNENLSNKKCTDLSEYITVYKIIPEKSKSEITPEKEPKPTSSSRKTKMDSVKGKLNDFFKHCKNSKRVRKSQSPVPTIPLTDVKQEVIDNESSDSKIDLEENSRLKDCDSVVKTENEMKNNGELEKAPNLHCHSCDFLADTKEIYSQHVSSCKDLARLSWRHNYVLNRDLIKPTMFYFFLNYVVTKWLVFLVESCHSETLFLLISC
ncbi:hypothetical protein B5X24_HaOG208770 [Helicoverpa armigera]|uniref:Uncharacterized protein n=1 Tax=Helicoverpa armigera TaxID=29058 RepID=A0A2W1BJC2_HELAM|nr:hypothetical protein B5X24_HaOG208770 [Helicoverpa armigera]